MKYLAITVALLCLAGLFLNLTPATSSAQAIVSRFPEDGTWARYKYQSSQLTKRGPWVAEDGEVFIRCLKTVTIDMKAYRWIEVEKKGRLAVSDHNYVQRWKVLISEDVLNKTKMANAGEDGILELWRQQGDQDPDCFKKGDGDLFGHWLALQPYFLNPQPNSTKDLDDVEVALDSGQKLTCSQKEADFTDKAGDVSVRSFQIQYHSEESPFGLVRSEFRREQRDAGKNVVDWSSNEFELVEIGKNAESSFSD